MTPIIVINGICRYTFFDVCSLPTGCNDIPIVCTSEDLTCCALIKCGTSLMCCIDFAICCCFESFLLVAVRRFFSCGFGCHSVACVLIIIIPAAIHPTSGSISRYCINNGFLFDEVFVFVSVIFFPDFWLGYFVPSARLCDILAIVKIPHGVVLVTVLVTVNPMRHRDHGNF